jgi:hypothetical protein
LFADPGLRLDFTDMEQPLSPHGDINTALRALPVAPDCYCYRLMSLRVGSARQKSGAKIWLDHLHWHRRALSMLPPAGSYWTHRRAQAGALIWRAAIGEKHCAAEMLYFCRNQRQYAIGSALIPVGIVLFCCRRSLTHFETGYWRDVC